MEVLRLENNLDYGLIGSRIKRERLQQNLTQDRLSEIAGISANHLSHIEAGTVKFSLPTIISIANALNTTPDFLLTDVIYSNKEYLLTELAVLVADFNRKQIYMLIEMGKIIKNADTLPNKDKFY